MSARQLIVLGVALLAAIGALFLVNGLGRNREHQQEQVQQIPGEDVLVVTRDVNEGVPLAANDLEWRRFPQTSVAPTFIKKSSQNDAQTAMTGAITRRAFASGEPVTQGSLILPGGHGAMAAQLPPGYRAVAVEIESATAAGGYIQPNDNVDVIVTTKLQVQGADGRMRDEVRSDVILENVRVLALDDKVQTEVAAEGPAPIAAEVAVLELTAADARTLALARELGKVSLALRGVETEAPGYRAPSAARRASALEQGAQAAGVRVHAFGAVQGAQQ
jgi:pilus assembly protein CpaB